MLSFVHFFHVDLDVQELMFVRDFRKCQAVMSMYRIYKLPVPSC